ncbi:MAG: PGPGW domain-containing protein [Patescibacteria group bacterium]
MRKKAKKILILTVGIIFIIFGLCGLVLPFLQGIIFLFIGFILLSFYFPKSYLWLEKHTEKYPRLFIKIKKVEAWIKKFIGEV